MCLCFAVWAGERVLFFAVWAGGVFFFLLFGRGSCLFFAVWAGGVFFLLFGPGGLFFLLFGRRRGFFCCLGRVRVFFFFAVWAGDGSSLIYRSAWLVVKRPNNKKDQTATTKKNTGSQMSDWRQIETIFTYSIWGLPKNRATFLGGPCIIFVGPYYWGLRILGNYHI